MRVVSGFKATWKDCPELFGLTCAVSLALFGIAWGYESWPTASIALLLAVIVGVMSFTHPEASGSDHTEYGDGGL